MISNEYVHLIKGMRPIKVIGEITSQQPLKDAPRPHSDYSKKKKRKWNKKKKFDNNKTEESD